MAKARIPDIQTVSASEAVAQDIAPRFQAWRNKLQNDLKAMLAKIESGRLSEDNSAYRSTIAILDAMNVQRERYGKCLGCDKKIPRARLEAMPETDNCVECQAELATTGAQRNDDKAFARAVDQEDMQRPS